MLVGCDPSPEHRTAARGRYPNRGRTVTLSGRGAGNVATKVPEWRSPPLLLFLTHAKPPGSFDRALAHPRADDPVTRGGSGVPPNWRSCSTTEDQRFVVRL